MGQRDALGELQIGEPGIALQGVQDLAVELVEFHRIPQKFVPGPGGPNRPCKLIIVCRFHKTNV